MIVRQLPPASLEDAFADLELANAALEHACHHGDDDELEAATRDYTAAARRHAALESQTPVRHMRAWA